MTDDTVATITKGYTFSEETIELGVLMADGNPVPDAKIRIPLGMLNRHGLIAGATGTGKTKTLQLLAEQISAAGVPARAAADAAQQAKDQATAEKEAAAQQKAAERATATQQRQAPKQKSVIEEVAQSSVFKPFVRSAGREIVRGIFGTALRK